MTQIRIKHFLQLKAVNHTQATYALSDCFISFMSDNALQLTGQSEGEKSALMQIICWVLCDLSPSAHLNSNVLTF